AAAAYAPGAGRRAPCASPARARRPTSRSPMRARNLPPQALRLLRPTGYPDRTIGHAIRTPRRSALLPRGWRGCRDRAYSTLRIRRSPEPPALLPAPGRIPPPARRHRWASNPRLGPCEALRERDARALAPGLRCLDR